MKLETSKGNMHPQEQQGLKVPPLRLPGSLSRAQRENGKPPRRGKVMLPVTRARTRAQDQGLIRGGTAKDTEDCARNRQADTAGYPPPSFITSRSTHRYFRLRPHSPEPHRLLRPEPDHNTQARS